MKCQKCGAELSEDSKFCPNCGDRIQQTPDHNDTILLRCKNCGGTMNVLEDGCTLECPFCGAREILKDNDSDREKEEAGFNENAWEIKRNNQRKWNEPGKKALVVISFIFMIICLISCLISFTERKLPAGLISAVQAGLFGATWIVGGIQKEKVKKAWMRVFAASGFLLIIPFIICADKSFDTYTWPDNGIASVLPKPEQRYGKIYQNSDTYFSLEVYRVSRDDYTAYINECRNKGFTVEAATQQNEYDAFNKDGYKLELGYYEGLKELSVRLEVPKTVGEFSWPTGQTASMLPVPKSKVGSIEWEYEESFSVYVGDTSVSDYNAYVDACITKGFTVGYERGEKYFYAKNAAGYDLSIKYEGNKVMSVRIRAPENTSQ